MLFGGQIEQLKPGIPVICAGCALTFSITVFDDRTYRMRVLTPATSFLLRRAAGLAAGSATPGRDAVATVTEAQLREIAQRKLPELNATDLAAAMRIVAGTARSMGIAVKTGDV